MRPRIALMLSVVVMLAPLAVFAQTASSNTDLTALLAEITALEQQITSLTGSSSSSASTPAPASTNSQSMSSNAFCPVLGRGLSLGATGEDVISLQTFLQQQGDLQASATGYFGALTQAAVSKWQLSDGVVASESDPGLGVVGPKTRAAIQESCTGSAATSVPRQCLPASPPSTDCSTTWQPVLDASGCTMYYQCTISLPTGTNTSPSSATSASTSTSSPATCPVVQKPSCTGVVAPFQTDGNGCVISYQCVI